MKAAVASTAVDAFVADLTSGGIVTRVLEAWSGGPVRAEVLATDADATDDVRSRLGVGDEVPLGYRRVRLLRGDIVLSEADNWFVRERLTPDMLDALDGTRTPFGIVIAPLAPFRETLACKRLAGDPMLLVSALVRAGDGLALAFVEERYRRAAIGG